MCTIYIWMTSMKFNVYLQIEWSHTSFEKVHSTEYVRKVEFYIIMEKNRHLK